MMDETTVPEYAGDSDSGVGESIGPSASSSSSHDRGTGQHDETRSSTSGVFSHGSNSTSGTGQDACNYNHLWHPGHSDSGVGESVGPSASLSSSHDRGAGQHDETRSSTSGVFSHSSNSTVTPGTGKEAGSVHVPLPNLPSISMIDVFLRDGENEHTISIDQDKTVRALRSCVQERTNIHPSQQHLSVDIMEGPNRVRTHVLEVGDDTRSLRDCRIVHRSRINMRVANNGTNATWGRANGHPRTAEQARNTLQVFVQTLSGKTITIDTCSQDTISALKRKIQAKTGDAPQQQALTHAGLPLNQDSKTLQNYNIKHHSTIVLNGRLRGGHTS